MSEKVCKETNNPSLFDWLKLVGAVSLAGFSSYALARSAMGPLRPLWSYSQVLISGKFTQPAVPHGGTDYVLSLDRSPFPYVSVDKDQYKAAKPGDYGCLQTVEETSDAPSPSPFVIKVFRLGKCNR